MRQHVLLAILAIVLFSDAGHAQKTESLTSMCATAQTPTEFAACEGEKLKAADAALSATMKAGLTAIDKASEKSGVHRKGWKSDLRDSHRLWLAHREKDCVALIAWEMDRGTGFPAASLGCKVEKTEARIIDLKSRLALP
jgi:uncharacterized protein YecT (DUF1311 family)